MTQTKQERITYPVRTMRISDPLWQRLRYFKFMSQKTWNRLLEQMLDRSESEQQTESDHAETKLTNADNQTNS